MTIKPRYRKKPSNEHGGYDLTVSLSLPAKDMADLLRAAGIGWSRIADRCPTEGFPADESRWRAKAAEANEAAMCVEQEEESAAMDRKESRRRERESEKPVPI